MYPQGSPIWKPSPGKSPPRWASENGLHKRSARSKGAIVKAKDWRIKWRAWTFMWAWIKNCPEFNRKRQCLPSGPER